MNTEEAIIELSRDYAGDSDEYREAKATAVAYLKRTVSADTKSVAEWVDKDVNGRTVNSCSNCREWGYTKWDIKTPYCPYCGRKMINAVSAPWEGDNS